MQIANLSQFLEILTFRTDIGKRNSKVAESKRIVCLLGLFTEQAILASIFCNKDKNIARSVELVHRISTNKNRCIHVSKFYTKFTKDTSGILRTYIMSNSTRNLKSCFFLQSCSNFGDKLAANHKELVSISHCKTFLNVHCNLSVFSMYILLF